MAKISTFDEKPIDDREIELLEHWKKLSPQMRKQFQREGPHGFLGMLVRKHLIHVDEMMATCQEQNPHLHPYEIDQIFMDQRWRLPGK